MKDLSNLNSYKGTFQFIENEVIDFHTAKRLDSLIESEYFNSMFTWSVYKNKKTGQEITILTPNQYGLSCYWYGDARVYEKIVEYSAYTVQELIDLLPAQTHNGASFGLQIQVCNKTQWSVQYYSFSEKKHSDNFPIIVADSIQNALAQMLIFTKETKKYRKRILESLIH